MSSDHIKYHLLNHVELIWAHNITNLEVLQVYDPKNYAFASEGRIF